MRKQNKIKNYLKLNEITYEDLAKQLNITKQAVGYQLTKDEDLTDRKFDEYLTTLNITKDELDEIVNPIIKEKEAEYGGLSLIKQIKLLEERNQAINIEFEKVKAQIIQLKKDCGHKEGCLIKNIKIENGEIV